MLRKRIRARGALLLAAVAAAVAESRMRPRYARVSLCFAPY